MIHHTYTDNKDKNRHLQYILLATFMLGLRNPSETCLLTIDDIQLNNNIIIVTEAKKHYSRRATTTEQQYMTGSNCKSMKYWIDNIRPRYTSQKSKNQLFITLTGNPFTPAYLRKYLTKHIQPHYPEYYPYCSRHWSATAKLIQEYINTGNWNKARVQHWLGHDNINTTDNYIQLAEVYMQAAPYDWFKRVLKRRRGGKHVKIGTYIKNHVCDSNYKESKGTDPQGFRTLLQKGNESVGDLSSSFSFSFFLELSAFDMNEEQYVFLKELPPCYNNCIAPLSSFISISPSISNNTGNSFFTIHHSFPVCYIRTDQHDRLWDTPVSSCYYCSYFFEGADLSFPLSITYNDVMS